MNCRASRAVGGAIDRRDFRRLTTKSLKSLSTATDRLVANVAGNHAANPPQARLAKERVRRSGHESPLVGSNRLVPNSHVVGKPKVTIRAPAMRDPANDHTARLVRDRRKNDHLAEEAKKEFEDECGL
jgi:hypothetical protein